MNTVVSRILLRVLLSVMKLEDYVIVLFIHPLVRLFVCSTTQSCIWIGMKLSGSIESVSSVSKLSSMNCG